MFRRSFVATATCALAFLAPATRADDRVIGGVPVSAAAWPASVYVMSGLSRCSGTLVGPRALLLAAHCVPDGGHVGFNVGGDDHFARCQRHPSYPSRDIDLALCLVNDDVKGVDFERISLDGRAVVRGRGLLLTGHGCVDATGSGESGVLHVGEVPVAGFTGYDVVTEGGVTMCFGDSGGAAYLVEGNRRSIVAVASKGNVKNRSYLAATFYRSAARFFRKWSENHGVAVCGVRGFAAGCPN